MQHVIAVANQKGGVAKTTTALNLAVGLSRQPEQYRVLMVDLDPQANATESLPVDLERAAQAGTYHVLEQRLSVADVVQQVGENLDLSPSHIGMARLEPTLSAALAAYRLQEALEEVDYDFVVIDCPPSLGGLTTNALVAATDVVVPVKPATYGLSAVRDFMDTFDLVQARMNEKLRLLGVLVTLYDSRTTLSKDAIAFLEEAFGDALFQTRIRMNVRLDEAASARQAIFDFAPSSSGAEDYDSFLKEVLARV